MRILDRTYVTLSHHVAYLHATGRFGRWCSSESDFPPWLCVGHNIERDQLKWCVTLCFGWSKWHWARKLIEDNTIAQGWATFFALLAEIGKNQWQNSSACQLTIYENIAYFLSPLNMLMKVLKEMMKWWKHNITKTKYPNRSKSRASMGAILSKWPPW